VQQNGELQITEPPDRAEVHDEIQGISSEPIKKLLIIEDNDVHRAALKEFLENNYVEILEASNEGEAIEKFKLSMPDLVHLATLRPTQAEPVWTTVATGRMPQTSGVRSAARYRARAEGAALDVLPDYIFAQALVRYGFLREEPHTRESLRAKPLWEILGERGIRIGLVGWPLTHPAPHVRGYVVSDVLHRVDDARMVLESASSVTPSACGRRSPPPATSRSRPTRTT
jgi:CheY-like chemotaxis protein